MPSSVRGVSREAGRPFQLSRSCGSRTLTVALHGRHGAILQQPGSREACSCQCKHTAQSKESHFGVASEKSATNCRGLLGQARMDLASVLASANLTEGRESNRNLPRERFSGRHDMLSKACCCVSATVWVTWHWSQSQCWGPAGLAVGCWASSGQANEASAIHGPASGRLRDRSYAG